jgi:phosphopantetheinyl transferase (holo-ACP synthase)
MIGNDIVDLDDEETKTGSIHPRFDERVFETGELAAIRASRHVHQLRWFYWAAKESAFKLLRRTLPDLPFSPRRFVTRASGPRSATVEASGHVVGVHCERGPDFIHCVASYRGAAATLQAVERLRFDAVRCEVASSAARSLALRSIARYLCVELADLAVDSIGRMPIVLRRGSRLPGTLSLSHHGRYVAFAWRGAAGVDPVERPRLLSREGRRPGSRTRPPS